MVSIAEKILLGIKKRKINQKILADMADLSEVAIGDIINEKTKKPRHWNLKKIERALKMTEGYLLSDEKTEEENMVKKRKAKFYNNETSKGFIDFINDEDEMILICPTKEEINWLKNNVVFMPDDKPTKQTYIDLLVIYRKLKKGEYNLEK